MSVKNEQILTDYDWLCGPQTCALKKPGSRIWRLAAIGELNGDSMPLGLQMQLNQSDARRGADPADIQVAGVGRFAVGMPRLPVAAGVVLIVLLVGIGAGCGLHFGMIPLLAPASSLDDLQNLLHAVLAALLVPSLINLLVSGLIAGSVGGNRSLCSFSLPGLVVQPVAWRLGVPVSVALLSLLLPLATIIVGAGIHGVAPDGALGLIAGSCLYLLSALFPLHQGPLARLLEGLLHLHDLPRQLRWTVIARFLPVRPVLQVSGGGSMAIAAASLAGWVVLAGGIVFYLGRASVEGMTVAGLIWKLGVTVVGLAYTLWLVWQIGGLFRSALALKSADALQPVHPPEAFVQEWLQSNALLAHVPELQSVTWNWIEAPAGTLLIRFGGEDRRFYWLASGTAQVLIRSASGDPLHIATLGAGAGIGEIAFIDAKKRTADVITMESSLVATLDYVQFQGIANDDVIRRFRAVVLASQAFARCRIFAGIPAADRERWIRNGRPVVVASGEELITEGAADRWMGMVVEGQLAVRRKGHDIAVLEPDAVFGEMAFLERGTRSATLTGSKPAVIWRWEAEWLDKETTRTGIRAAMENLASQRRL